MTFKEVKKNLKKDPAGSIWIELYRKIGLLITYILIKIFPRIKANFVTIFMLLLNIVSVVFIYIGVYNASVKYILISFIIYFIATALDCTDGNIARLKKETSYIGIFLDRLCHNIHHPLFFLVLGYAIGVYKSNYIIILVFAIFAIISEFSPIEIAKKDVQNSFVKQLIFKKSVNFDISTHTKKLNSNLNDQFIPKKDSKVKKIIKILFSFLSSFENIYFILIITIYFSISFIYLTIYIALIMGMKIFKEIIKKDLKLFMENLKYLEGKLNE